MNHLVTSEIAASSQAAWQLVWTLLLILESLLQLHVPHIPPSVVLQHHSSDQTNVSNRHNSAFTSVWREMCTGGLALRVRELVPQNIPSCSLRSLML